MRDELVPGEGQIFSWIEEVYAHGVRRPGYAADRWAESWLQERFRELGLERVRAEPVPLPYWEPLQATLSVCEAGGAWRDVPCFPLPLAADADGVELDLRAFDDEAPGGLRGAASLCGVALLRLPHAFMRDHMSVWAHDPAGTFDRGSHVVPFGRAFQEVMEPSIAAGAGAFVGVLDGYPGGSREYYVPYDGTERSIPGVWVSEADGAMLRGMLSRGAVRVRVTVASRREAITSYNIVGELPGASERQVIIGSHHDGPWASAVEDGSGIAMVLAQAAYWSRVPTAERPHNLLFLLNAGHMAGGAGQRAYVERHRAELGNVVLELHLEHIAAEFSDEGGALRATGEPEVGWWFTSEDARLQALVREAIEAEDVRRSLIVKPTVFGEKPTTDAADFYPAGVPIVNVLAAPFYLFDAMDTLDKIYRPHLVPVTRAAIRIVEGVCWGG